MSEPRTETGRRLLAIDALPSIEDIIAIEDEAEALHAKACNADIVGAPAGLDDWTSGYVQAIRDHGIEEWKTENRPAIPAAPAGDGVTDDTEATQARVDAGLGVGWSPAVIVAAEYEKAE